MTGDEGWQVFEAMWPQDKIERQRDPFHQLLDTV